MKTIRLISLYLRNAVRRWLGLGEIIMGIDVGFKDNTVIVIISRHGDGSVRIIDTHLTNLQEVNSLARELKERYHVLDKNIVVDWPMMSRGDKMRSFFGSF